MIPENLFQAYVYRICLLPKHLLIYHIIVSSKLRCRISINDFSELGSLCMLPCYKEPTNIAKGFPILGMRTKVLAPSLFWALTGQLALFSMKKVHSSPSALKSSFVSDYSHDSTLSLAYTASHIYPALLTP